MSQLTLVIANKNYSSWSLRAWVYLVHHRIAFEEVRIALAQPDTARRIHAWSPSGKLPVLVDGELAVWDSLAILEYLAERYPRTQGWPQDPAERALARSLSAEMHSGFLALRQGLPMNVRRRLPRADWPEAVQRDISRVQEIWALCRDRHAERGPFLFGQFGIVDAMFAPVAWRFLGYEVTTNAIARQYVHDLAALPAMKRWQREAQAETELIEAYER